MKPMHYWTGRGTLCSLDNSTKRKLTHTDHWPSVTCKYCNHIRAVNAKKAAEGGT